MPRKKKIPIYSVLKDPACINQQLRAFIYDRNSRMTPKNRVGDRTTSTIAQNSENHRYCANKGWLIGAEYADPGRGASRHSADERPGFDAMMERLKMGIRPGERHAECDVLVVWEQGRATRDLEVYVHLRKVCEQGGILLCYNGNVFDMSNSGDRQSTAYSAVQAESEADRIWENVMRTTQINAERGRPHGRVPYGYRRRYDENTGTLIDQVPDEHQQNIMIQIAECGASQGNKRELIKNLNERGELTPSGKPGEWTVQMANALLRRPTNIGERVHRGEVIGQAAWASLFDEALYLTAVANMDEAGAGLGKGPDVVHLFSGIPYCGPCSLLEVPRERFLQSHRNDGKMGYACKTCFGVWVEEKAFDDFVVSAVLTYAERPGLAAALARPSTGSEAVRRALAESRALEGQIAEARQLAKTIVDGQMGLSAMSLASLEHDLLPRIEKLRAQARDATVPAALYRLAGPGARQAWGELDMSQRRAALRAVVKVTAFPGGRGRKVPVSQRCTLEWLR